jgi:hypothetical protein
MHTHSLHRGLGVAIAAALAAGALAGPAMAAGDGGSADPQCRKAGEKPLEYLVLRKAGRDAPDFAGAPRSGGEPEGSIIAI